MALSGINLAPAFVGQEAAWQRVEYRGPRDRAGQRGGRGAS